MNRNCLARQHSDQMICTKCGLVWDVNDPEPPECKRDEHPVILDATQDTSTIEQDEQQ